LVWTAPVGMIWQFYVYDLALQWMSRDFAQMLGDGVTIFLGAVFWFMFLPWLISNANAWWARSRNG